VCRRAREKLFSRSLAVGVPNAGSSCHPLSGSRLVVVAMRSFKDTAQEYRLTAAGRKNPR
jgi:hypothetical protein